MTDKPVYYILAADGMTPVAISDMLEWCRWREARLDPHIEGGDVEHDGVRVSTVFLGLDHRFGMAGPPILWETMIFGGEHSEDQWRYCSYEEASVGHLEACRSAFGEPVKRGIRLKEGDDL